MVALAILAASSVAAHDAVRPVITDWQAGMSFSQKLEYIAPLSRNVEDRR